MQVELATFGAGCFWSVEMRFGEISGVLQTTAGYEGGTLDNPTYKDVCTDGTGHTEVVEVEFDPQQVSYDALLDAFFSQHDPTQLNRQGPDWGTQYRSVIFVHDDFQRKAAEAKILQIGIAELYRKPIATAVEAAQTFWRAEEYHQKYLEKRGMAACHL